MSTYNKSMTSVLLPQQPSSRNPMIKPTGVASMMTKKSLLINKSSKVTGMTLRAEPFKARENTLEQTQLFQAGDLHSADNSIQTNYENVTTNPKTIVGDENDSKSAVMTLDELID